MGEHISPLPGQIYQKVNYFDTYEASVERVDTIDVDEADVIISAVYNQPDMHKLILDLDLPAQLIPSTTAGHFHLYVDKEIPWRTYKKLLKVLAQAGLIEQGYANVSLERGYTAARLPWIKKLDSALRPRCIGCGKQPNELNEYLELAEREGYDDAATAVRREEGTYNGENGHFWCTACYLKAGQPLGVAL